MGWNIVQFEDLRFLDTLEREGGHFLRQNCLSRERPSKLFHHQQRGNNQQMRKTATTMINKSSSCYVPALTQLLGR